MRFYATVNMVLMFIVNIIKREASYQLSKMTQPVNMFDETDVNIIKNGINVI